MTGRVAGKLALVTGGASGLGEAIAMRLAAEGARVTIADVDAAEGQRVATDIGGRFELLDVTSEPDWINVVDQLEQRDGALDILVNSAGITIPGSIAELSVESFKRMLDVDLTGLFIGCKKCLPLLARHGGTIINLGSMCGIKAQPDLAGYNAAKAAVIHLTRSIALYCAAIDNGVRCNSVNPGAIHTPILDKVLGQVADPAAVYASWVASHPIGRLGTPDEIAAIVLYLASDESKFTTGAAFAVDGGASL